jgi:hypothetical protein
MNIAASLKGLYQALDFDRPLDYANEDDKKLYVAGMHGIDGNPVDELRANIEMSDKPQSWLFTGHRGVGKSTELRRLAAELPRADFLVSVADAGEYLNLAEPISTEILLLTLVAALADAADNALGGKRLEPNQLSRFWSFLKDTHIEMPELGEAVGAKVTLKQTPNLQQKIQAATDGATARLAAQVREFALEVVKDVRQAKGEHVQVVLILDSLERLRVTGGDAQTCYDAITQTFDTNGEFLKLEHLHVVYSVPPYLPFLTPRIGSYFGVQICSLPHIKVFETPADFTVMQAAQPCAAGQKLMLESVLKRYPLATELIPQGMLEQLALASSGSMRDFFRLIRSVCGKAQVVRPTLPLADDKLVRQAQQVLCNEMPLAEDDKIWLKKVRATHGTGLDSIGNLAQLARLFDCGVILTYRNGSDWCDVHYLLHDQLGALAP